MSGATLQEIDYVLEGQNADRFRTNFASTPWVKVPAIVWPLTSERVLTMEFVPGVKINRAAEIDKLGIDRALLAQRAVESYLQQLLTYGFFHAGGDSASVYDSPFCSSAYVWCVSNLLRSCFARFLRESCLHKAAQAEASRKLLWYLPILMRLGQHHTASVLAFDKQLARQVLT